MEIAPQKNFEDIHLGHQISHGVVGRVDSVFLKYTPYMIIHSSTITLIKKAEIGPGEVVQTNSRTATSDSGSKARNRILLSRIRPSRNNSLQTKLSHRP